MIPEAHYFEVNSPLWSDGSSKKRWVILKAGTSIGYRELDDYWDYPDGAVFVKEFAIDTVAGDSATRVVWETRFLINKKERLDPGSSRLTDRWHGIA